MSARLSCEHAASGRGQNVCPGCPAIALEPAAQREAKRERARASLARFGVLAEIAQRVEDVPAIGPAAGYRTRAKLIVGGARRGAPPRLGLYREGAHDVLDLPGCAVLAPAIAEAAAAVRALLREPPPEAGGALVATEDGGALEAIDLREVRSDGEARAMLTLVVDRTRAPSEGAARAAAEALRRACPRVASIAINLRGRGPQVLGAETHVLVGPAELPDRIEEGAPYVLATHGSFVQAHRAVAAAIHAEVEREIATLGPAPRVIELFAGSGALALRLAARGARVHAIESFAPAIELARWAADAQRISGLSIEAADARAALAHVARSVGEEEEGERADAIVLDPPRRGLEPGLRASIARLAPARVVYVSCDPDTLARDLAHLARLGLAATRAAPFDLMPQTAHVETLAVLAPAPLPRLRLIHDDDRLIAIEKDPHEPVAPRGGAAHDTLARVRALPGASDAVPVGPLEDETSGVAVFARRPDDAAALERALGSARVSWVALARGITRAQGIIRRRARGARDEATTRFLRRAIVGGHSLLRASPGGGGNEAQIRGHLASIGHPVLGDGRDGDPPSNRHLWESAALDRAFLHVERVELALAGAPPLVLYAKLAPDLALVLERLRARADTPPRA